MTKSSYIEIMKSALVPHPIAPEPGVLDTLGRRWCLACRRPEGNVAADRAHALMWVDDPIKARILGEREGE